MVSFQVFKHIPGEHTCPCPHLNNREFFFIKDMPHLFKLPAHHFPECSSKIRSCTIIPVSSDLLFIRSIISRSRVIKRHLHEIPKRGLTSSWDSFNDDIR